MDITNVYKPAHRAVGIALLIGYLTISVRAQEPGVSGEPSTGGDVVAKCTKILTYGAVHDYFKPTKKDAVITLGIVGDERAVPTLIAHLENEDNAELRKEIVRALGLIRSVKAVPALEAALKDKYPHTRRHAAYALKEITGKDYEYDKSGLPDLSKIRELPKASGREAEQNKKG
jgi:hypothetical protein